MKTGARTRPTALYNQRNEPERNFEFRNSMKGNCECRSERQREKAGMG